MKTLKTPGCHSEKPLAGFSKRKELRLNKPVDAQALFDAIAWVTDE